MVVSRRTGVVGMIEVQEKTKRGIARRGGEDEVARSQEELTMPLYSQKVPTTRPAVAPLSRSLSLIITRGMGKARPRF